MNKHPFTESFIKTSLNKAISPFSLASQHSSLSPTLTLRPRTVAMASPSRSHSSAIRTPTTFSLWSAVAIACIALLSVSTLLPLTADAAPAKKTIAPESLINAMAISTSETSPLPLQLQIESQVEGRQRLAYLPTTGPSMDFYYLNYRPSYRAGESKVDFWMLTPKGTPAPKTGSLELYDEFGKIRLAVLVPEGTEIPQGEANKNEPFLWKSWAVPKTLKADFDFSEKFRVVLKTSDSKPASASTIITTAKKNKNKNKRWDYDATLKDFLLARKKNSAVVTAATVPAAAPVPANSVASSPIVVQDRQFHIKGLQATPGGKPNPAKLNVNKVITPPSQVAPNQIIPSQVDVDSKASNINSKSRISDNTAINTGADAHANANKPVSGKTNNNINNKSVVSSAMTRTVLPPFATILVVLLSALTALY